MHVPPTTVTDTDEVAKRVRDVLHDQYKDTRYLELETAEAIANRVMGWAKLFGFFAGIPLVIIAVWLGWLGYKSISDITAEVKKVQTLVDSLEKDVIAKRAQLDKLNELDELERRLTALSSRVQTLEAVKFGGSADIGAAAKKRIEDALGRYQQRFASLGYRFPANQEVNVRTEPSAAMRDRGMIALYEKKTMFVDEKYTAHDDVVLREYTHHILLRGDVRALGGNNDLRSLESGLADYFSRSFEGSPEYPSIPGRTLANDLKIVLTRNPADIQNIGLAWGALGWDLRARIGRDAADALLLAAWDRTNIRGAFEPSDFGKALLTADQTVNRGANATLIRELLAKRGVSV
jgi:hypothetical protein